MVNYSRMSALYQAIHPAAALQTTAAMKTPADSNTATLDHTAFA
ncbi:hypothetical protein [Dactylosporangium sp. NPDC048998]